MASISLDIDVFLSTPSARRATLSCLQFVSDSKISIHALREEGDHFMAYFSARYIHFYPRPPRGGRRVCLTKGATA